MNYKRYSGILLHPTSLPGDYGIGTLGKEAKKWIDFLEQAEQKWWQILPLGHTGFGDSPYQCFSSFAGNPLLIDVEELVKEDLLAPHDIQPLYEPKKQDKVDFHLVIQKKYPVLRLAYQRFVKQQNTVLKREFDSFYSENAEWLDDYALFLEIKSFHNENPWNMWPDPFKKRDASALQRFKEDHRDAISFHYFCQWMFFRQWTVIKEYANKKNIEIIGDIPLYIAYDSSDAWTAAELFQFDETLTPTVIAGVPPDYFSKTGQLWGNPIYDWDRMEKDGFRWWIKRIGASLEWYDWIRIDHFRGLSDYWAVPYGESTAINGTWIPVPGQALFETLMAHFGSLKIIAEDLGAVTPEVWKLRDNFNFPGMRILQYAFFSSNSEDLPHNFIQNCVVYTGTHDNESTAGWYKNLDPKSKDRLHTYLQSEGTDIHWKMIRLAWASVANFAIVPMQDILGLDNDTRMNIPGTIGGINWQWRLQSEQIDQEVIRVLKFLTVLFERNLSK